VSAAWPLVVLLVAGCSRNLDVDDTGDTDDTGVIDDTGDTGSTGPLGCSAHMNLELVPLDIWGRDLDGAVVRFDREPFVLENPGAGPGVVLAPLGSAVELQVVVEAAGYRPTGLTITYDGSHNWSGFSLSEPTEDGRAVASFEQRPVEGGSCPVFSLYVGVDHMWFSPSGRAPNPNGVTFLMDGEELWASAKPDLEQATERVTWATWWWESDFELVRPPGHASMSEAQRAPNTAMAVLEGLQGVERRIIVNRFWSDNLDFLTYLNSDSALRDHAQSDDDDFEVVLQGNPTEVPLTGQFQGQANPWYFGDRVLSNPRYADRELVIDDRQGSRRDLIIDAATWHQKAFAIDGRVAYVSGMNTKGTDWDSHDHKVFDERRMEFDASKDDRMAVLDREEEPDFGPRKDYGVRLEGPGARDVDDILWGRWEWAIAEDHLYAKNATHYTLGPPAPAPAGAVPAQVVATQPQPFGERSILETQIKAIGHATQYLYVEDQYFRAPILADLIVSRMLEEPDLLLIVISKPISDWDGGAKFTYLADATFRSMFPDRYLLLQLKSVDLVIDPGFFWDDVDLYTADMDTHSKLRLVDDTYLSVGSCNFHNRAYLFEGEMNVSVLDPTTVRDVRRRVFANLVGPAWAPMLTDDPANNFDVLALAAADNAALLAWWEENASDLDADEAEAAWSEYHPSGFVYPLEISSDYMFDVGPDIF